MPLVLIPPAAIVGEPYLVNLCTPNGGGGIPKSGWDALGSYAIALPRHR